MVKSRANVKVKLTKTPLYKTGNPWRNLQHAKQHANAYA